VYIFITALSSIAKKWRQSECVSISEWINELPYNEIYSAINRVGIVAHTCNSSYLVD
jgi:hypothetical protein